MQLLLFRHNWGLPESSWEEKLEKISRGGFSGVETSALLPVDYKHFRELLGKYRLRFIPQIFTSGSGVKEHLASFRQQIAAVSMFAPTRVNCHSGSDRWTPEESMQFYREAMRVEADT